MTRSIGTNWYAIRWSVLNRDNFTCQYCGQFAPNVILNVDHRVEVCNGGTDDFDNLVTACSACNQGKEGFRANTIAKAPVSARRARPSGAAQSRPAVLTDRIANLLSNGPMPADEIATALGTNLDVTRVRLSQKKGVLFARDGHEWRLLHSDP